MVRTFSTGAVKHQLIVAADSERETFHARDTIYGGFTDQDRLRDHNAITGEWRASTPALTGDFAVRRDMFNGFKDATSVRASLITKLGGGFALAGSYAEGISEPTFFDLYGFFPANFVGNPLLRPESSSGFETSLRYRKGTLGGSLTAFRQRLHDEIVDVSDPTTFLQTAINIDATSYRSGIEAEGYWKLNDAVRLSANYAFLHATQPNSTTQQQITELRRPKRSGSITVDGSVSRWSYGASVSYVGTHLDSSDNYPFSTVQLHSYWLADARLGYAIGGGIEVYVRGSNLFNSHYEDLAGYHTEGRGVFAGVRLASR